MSTQFLSKLSANQCQTCWHCWIESKWFLHVVCFYSLTKARRGHCFLPLPFSLPPTFFSFVCFQCPWSLYWIWQRIKWQGVGETKDIKGLQLPVENLFIQHLGHYHLIGFSLYVIVLCQEKKMPASLVAECCSIEFCRLHFST